MNIALRKRTLSPVRLVLEDSSKRSFMLFVVLSFLRVLPNVSGIRRTRSKISALPSTSMIKRSGLRRKNRDTPFPDLLVP